MAEIRCEAGCHDNSKSTGLRCSGWRLSDDGKVGAASLVAGDHGTTYGGNPFACAAISKVIDLFEEERYLIMSGRSVLIYGKNWTN